MERLTLHEEEPYTLAEHAMVILNRLLEQPEVVVLLLLDLAELVLDRAHTCVRVYENGILLLGEFREDVLL